MNPAFLLCDFEKSVFTDALTYITLRSKHSDYGTFCPLISYITDRRALLFPMHEIFKRCADDRELIDSSKKCYGLFIQKSDGPCEVFIDIDAIMQERGQDSYTMGVVYVAGTIIHELQHLHNRLHPETCPPIPNFPVQDEVIARQVEHKFLSNTSPPATRSFVRYVSDSMLTFT